MDANPAIAPLVDDLVADRRSCLRLSGKALFEAEVLPGTVTSVRLPIV